MAMDLMIDFDTDDTGEFSYEALVKEDLFLFGHGLSADKTISFSALTDYKLILPDREHAMGKTLAGYELETGTELTRLPTTLAVYPMLSLVTSGIGHSISPWSLIHDRIDGEITPPRILNPTAGHLNPCMAAVRFSIGAQLGDLCCLPSRDKRHGAMQKTGFMNRQARLTGSRGKISNRYIYRQIKVLVRVKPGPAVNSQKPVADHPADQTGLPARPRFPGKAEDTVKKGLPVICKRRQRYLAAVGHLKKNETEA